MSDSFATQLQQYLAANGDPVRAEKEKAYLYSDLKHYGVPFGKQNAFTRSHKKYLKALPKPEALRLVRHLWEQPSFEERIMATSILSLHAESLTPKDLPLIEKMMRESGGWALLDNLIIPIMPHLLSKYPEIYDVLSDWIKDDDYWVRRSALLAQLLFFRRGEGGRPAFFFQLAQSQLDEFWINDQYPDALQRKRARFFIRKAIGWTLREMSAHQPQKVVAFLKANRDQMSGLSFREGSRKLPTAFKKQLA